MSTFTMSRRASHLHGTAFDKPDGPAGTKPPQYYDIDQALTQLAYLAHVTASVSLADKAKALRELDHEIEVRCAVLARDLCEQAAGVWERFTALIAHRYCPRSNISASQPSKPHTKTSGCEERIPCPASSPGTLAPDRDPEALLVDAALEPFFAGLTTERLVAAAEAHADTLGKSTMNLARRAARQMRWHVIAGLRQAERRRAAHVAEMERLHDGLRPWHTGVCRSPTRCLMCAPYLLLEKAHVAEGESEGESWLNEKS